MGPFQQVDIILKKCLVLQKGKKRASFQKFNIFKIGSLIHSKKRLLTVKDTDIFTLKTYQWIKTRILRNKYQDTGFNQFFMLVYLITGNGTKEETRILSVLFLLHGKIQQI